MNEDDIKKLQEAYALRGVAIHQLQERVSSLEEEITRLKELLRLQQERLFGKKSEISNRILSTSSPSHQTTQVASHTRTIPSRGNRQLNTGKFLTLTTIHDLSDIEKKCACCGKTMHVMGKDVSEQLEIIPIQYCKIEHIRLK